MAPRKKGIAHKPRDKVLTSFQEFGRKRTREGPEQEQNRQPGVHDFTPTKTKVPRRMLEEENEAKVREMEQAARDIDKENEQREHEFEARKKNEANEMKLQQSRKAAGDWMDELTSNGRATVRKISISTPKRSNQPFEKQHRGDRPSSSEDSQCHNAEETTSEPKLARRPNNTCVRNQLIGRFEHYTCVGAIDLISKEEIKKQLDSMMKLKAGLMT